MTDRFLAFALYDNAGQPLAGESPTFSSYTPGAAPSIIDIGGGLYAFEPDADAEFEITTGAAPPSFTGEVVDESSSVTFASTTTPTFAAYKDRTGANLSPQPSITDNGDGTWTLVVSATHYSEGVAFELDATPRQSGCASETGNLVAFAVYDAEGAPLAGAAPTFGNYCDRAGASRAAPSIEELGSGLYAFVPSSDDLSVGITFELETGGYPTRLSGFAFSEGGGVFVTIRSLELATAGAKATTVAKYQVAEVLSSGSVVEVDE